MSVNVYQSVERGIVSKRAVSQIVVSVLRELGRKESDVSIHVVGDRRMKTLNEQYRRIRKTTDVLSFSLEQRTSLLHNHDLGDIFISAQEVRRQARRFTVPEKEEFVRVMIHGILHLLGYDHEKKREAKKMFRVQERLLSAILKDM